MLRHPVLRHAEIRDTGRWLHAIVRFDQPVQLHSEAEQREWAGRHTILKASVPSISAAPVLHALTRPVGSVNGKTGRAVRTLEPGLPVPTEDLKRWVAEVRTKPFATIAYPLFGAERVTPCPYCRQKGSRLDLGDSVGHCYGPCRQVPITRVLEPFLKVPEPPAKDPGPGTRAGAGKARKKPGAAVVPKVIDIDGPVVLRVANPALVRTITIEVVTE